MTTIPQLPQWLEIATQAALQGGAVLKKYWGKLTEINEKFPGDLVTEADKQSEVVILERLRNAFPDHQILAEESGLHKKDFPISMGYRSP